MEDFGDFPTENISGRKGEMNPLNYVIIIMIILLSMLVRDVATTFFWKGSKHKMPTANWSAAKSKSPTHAVHIIKICQLIKMKCDDKKKVPMSLF